MDDLSQSLNCCKTGCLSGEIMINHLMYADDLLLLSPSATWLRELLRTCEKYSKEHAILFIYLLRAEIIKIQTLFTSSHVLVELS